MHGDDSGTPPDGFLRNNRFHGDDDGIPPDDQLRIQKNLNNIAVFPNPMQAHAYIVTPVSGKHQVLVYNLAGQEMLNASFNGDRLALNLEKLPSGVYWMKIYDAQNQSTLSKIVKQ